MGTFRSSRRRWRLFVVTVGSAATALVAGAAIAFATVGYPTDSVTVMSACLTTSGASAGVLGSVAVGNNPAKSCGSNQTLVHLSGGTITRVTAGTGVSLAGSGGTGGTGYVNNGSTTVGLDSHYQLPQSNCSSGQFVASDGSGGWSCQTQKTYSGSDFALSNQSCDTGEFLTGFSATGTKQCGTDQTYKNGTGLSLTGNEFSLDSDYQLPQSCTNGQLVKSDGNNGWACTSAASSEGVSDLSDYEMWWPISLGDDDSGTASAYCNSGDIATGGGWTLGGDTSIIESGPTSSNGYEGWFAKGETGFGFGFNHGGLTVWVKCLTTLH